jgi:hypothetical protein
MSNQRLVKDIFLWSMSAIYLFAFGSLYVQIPGKKRYARFIAPLCVHCSYWWAYSSQKQQPLTLLVHFIDIIDLSAQIRMANEKDKKNGFFRNQQL